MPPSTSMQRPVKKSFSTMNSAAEAISVMSQCLALSAYFGEGEPSPRDVASALKGAVVRDQNQDEPVWREYLEVAMKEREGWGSLYQACREELS